MLKEALSYPLEADHKFKTVGIGAGLQFSAVIILSVSALFGGLIFVPAFVIALLLMIAFWGYYVRVLRRAANEDGVLPEFDDWVGLGVEGIKFFGVILGYMAIPLLLLIIEVVFLTSDSGAMTAVGDLVYMIAWLITLVIVFFLPVGLTNYALTDRVRGAFVLRDVFDAALTRSYVIAAVLTLPFWVFLNIYQELDGII